MCLVAEAIVFPAFSNERAIWVWDMGPKIVMNESEHHRSEFYSFMAAPHGNSMVPIETIFLFAETNINDQDCITDGINCKLLRAGRLREFIADAHSRGMEVHYLDGDPIWGLRAPYNETPNRLLSTIFSYNAASMPEERFDAIQFDVEPWVLSGQNQPLSWQADEAQIWLEYRQNLVVWQGMVDQHNLDTGDQLRFGVDIPRWWDREPTLDMSNQIEIPSLDIDRVDHRVVQQIVDYIAILDYVTKTPDYTCDICSEFLFADDPNGDGDSTDAMSRSVYVGLESINITSKESVGGFFKYLYTNTTSFFHQTFDNMQSAAQDISSRYDSGSDTIDQIDCWEVALENLQNVVRCAAISSNSLPFQRQFASFAGIAYHYYEDIRNGETAFRALTSTAGNKAPVSTIIRPAGREIFAQNLNESIRYSAYDPDGDILNVNISISTDGGVSWMPLPTTDAADDPISNNDGLYVLDTSILNPGTNYKLRVDVSENAPGVLTTFDVSDFKFSIVTAHTDSTAPSPGTSTIRLDAKTPHPLKRFYIEWDSFQSSDINGYYFSIEDTLNPADATFTRGNSGYLTVPEAGLANVSVWAVDHSGNISARITKSVTVYEDRDHDGKADVVDSDMDGDGISNLDETALGSNSRDPLNLGAPQVIGLWNFDANSLANSVAGAADLTLVSGSISYPSFPSGSGNTVLHVEELIDASPSGAPVDYGQSRLSFTNNLITKIVSAFTIEMWVRPDQSDPITYIPLFFEGDIDSGFALLLRNEADRLELRYYHPQDTVSGSFIAINTENNAIFDGNWHHIAATYNGHDRMLALFIDGVMASQMINNNIPTSYTLDDPLRLFDASSKFDSHNGSTCDITDLNANSCTFHENSSLLESNLFKDWDLNTRFVGEVDNIRLTLASVPAVRLGFYTDATIAPDTDADGINDSWEIFYFQDITAMPGHDSDGDGSSNLQEFTNGSDPTRYEINLSQGWNLVSFARLPNNNTVANIFAEIPISNSIWMWDEGRFNVCSDLNSQRGYWVYLDEEWATVKIQIPDN